MKNVLFCLSLLVSGAALAADPLADANALFEQKAYPQALQAYTKLANGGNAEAQQKLGQMYWYGEAGSVDQAKAEAWFSKSAAKGNKVAAASLELMKQRVARRAEIEHWTSKYDGAELASGQFRCPAPRIPAVSKMNEEIDRVSGAVTAWQDCYNRFVVNLNAASPLIKRIPPDIAKLMNKEELEKARLHLEGVQANLTENAKVNAKLLLADYAVWRSATEAWVSEHNAIVRSAPKDTSPAR
jgi:hypothetical protein